MSTPQNAAQGSAPVYNPEIITEAEAWRMWRHCVRAINHAAVTHHQSPGSVQIQYAPADIVTLFGRRGELIRFWVHHPMDRRLVIVGNEKGLLPIDVEPLHATH